MNKTVLNLADKESIVALMFDVQNGRTSCRRAATEIQDRYNSALDALYVANEKTRERLKVSDELADGLIEESNSLKALCDKWQECAEAFADEIGTTNCGYVALQKFEQLKKEAK